MRRSVHNLIFLMHKKLHGSMGPCHWVCVNCFRSGRRFQGLRLQGFMPHAHRDDTPSSRGTLSPTSIHQSHHVTSFYDMKFRSKQITTETQLETATKLQQLLAKWPFCSFQLINTALLELRAKEIHTKQTIQCQLLMVNVAPCAFLDASLQEESLWAWDIIMLSGKIMNVIGRWL